MSLRFLWFLLFFQTVWVTNGQVDSILYFDGVIKNILEEIPKESKENTTLFGAKNLVWRPLPSDTSLRVACIYPLLVMGKDQIDSYFEFVGDKDLEKDIEYIVIIDLGLVSKDGYFPDSLNLWLKSANMYGLREKSLLTKFEINKLCDGGTQRYTAKITLPFKSKFLELGADPLIFKSRSSKVLEVSQAHENIIFCNVPESISKIPVNDSPLIYIERILVLKR